MTHRPWLDPISMPVETAVVTHGVAAASDTRGGANEASPQDRRASPRRPHRVFQWIAPCLDGKLPDQSMFYQVQCIDISRTGVAFYTYEPLPSDEVIIAIGTTADAVYVRSRVANCVPVADAEGMRYRVGCEFIERLGDKSSPSE
jgi:hypothetical protein